MLFIGIGILCNHALKWRKWNICFIIRSRNLATSKAEESHIELDAYALCIHKGHGNPNGVWLCAYIQYTSKTPTITFGPIRLNSVHKLIPLQCIVSEDFNSSMDLSYPLYGVGWNNLPVSKIQWLHQIQINVIYSICADNTNINNLITPA